MSVYRPSYRDPKTGKLKQSRVWWYEFTYDGGRVRESAKTTRKTVALSAEKDRRLELEESRATGKPREVRQNRIRTVKSALAAYLKTYPINHRAKSVAVVKERSPHLERHLGNLLMPDLTQDRITAYMAERKGEGVGNRTINLELSVLSRAIGSKFQILWPKLKRLEENHDVGRALEPDEEQAIMEAAARNRSRLIHPFLYTLAWTGTRSDEARTLRWSQVDFEAGEIVVGKSKTKAGRGRRIPMSANLKAILGTHASWYAVRFGTIQPDWYVFPKSNRSAPVDPLKPIGSLKTAWETVRENAKVACRLHDLRHTFCTKLAEADVPESTMLDIMGHMSAAMLRRYSHIRAKARRDAIDAVELRQSSLGVPKVSPKVSDSAMVISAVTH
jgi:integrase